MAWTPKTGTMVDTGWKPKTGTVIDKAPPLAAPPLTAPPVVADPFRTALPADPRDVSPGLPLEHRAEKRPGPTTRFGKTVARSSLGRYLTAMATKTGPMGSSQVLLNSYNTLVDKFEQHTGKNFYSKETTSSERRALEKAAKELAIGETISDPAFNWMFNMPPAKGIKEKVTEFTGEVTGFVGSIYLAKQALGGPPSLTKDIMAWEMVNQSRGGVTGTGAAEAFVWKGVAKAGGYLFGKVWKAIKVKYPDFAYNVSSRWQKARTGKAPAEATKNRADAIRARKHFKKTGEIPDDLARKYGFGQAVGPKPIPAEQPVVADFGKYPLARAIVKGKKPAIPKPIIKPAKPVVKPKVVAPEVKPEAPATTAQKRQAHIIARQKAFISEKGKMRPGYRALTKARFIDAIGRLPEPTMRRGKAIPPSIPRTTKLATIKQFQRIYKKPTPWKYLTSQTYYSEVLGTGEITRPLEAAKQRFDLEFKKASNEVDKKIAGIDKFYGTTFKEKLVSKLKNRPTKAVAKMRYLLNKYETPPANLSIEEAQMFNWFRDLNKEVLRRENEVRASLDMPQIKERKAYVRHVADVLSQEMLDGKYPFPEGRAYWAQRTAGKKIFNPMEFQRKVADDIEGLFTKDLGYATKSMLWTGLKEVHLNQPLKFFSEQLGAISKDVPIYKGLSTAERQRLPKVMPAGTKKWLIDYVNQVIKGQETWLDKEVNNLVTETGLGGLFNKVLKPFGRTISRKPQTRLFQKAGRKVILSVMGWRPKQLIRNKLQFVQNMALYGLKANLKSFMPASEQLRKIIDDSLFIKSYTGFEELPKDLMSKFEKAWLAPYQWTAVSNAVKAMKTAYWDTMDLISKPKYKKYGWADPKRTYKEAPEYLYPSELEKIKREMDFGAGCTQYQYIPIGMPEIFRHKALIPVTRLQSWWMNHFAKFHREAAHRFLKGEPMWSDGSVKLPWSRRLGWFRYLALGGLILNTLGYTRSFLFGAAPTGLPPAAQLALGSYIYLTSFFSGDSDEWKEKNRKKAKKAMYNAILLFVPTYLAYKDYEAIWSGRKDLKSLFFYEKMKKKGHKEI